MMHDRSTGANRPLGWTLPRFRLLSSPGLKRRLTFLPIVALTLLATGCDGPVEREAKFMRRAEEHLVNRRLDKAMLELRNVLQINPTNVKAIFQVGVIEEERGNLRQAFGVFNQVVTQSPTHVGANLHLARFFLVAGDLDEAEKRIKIAVEQEPENPQGKALRGALLLRRGHVDQAIELATAAIKADQNNLQAITVLVTAYRNQKKFDEALSVLAEAIRREPKNVSHILLRISLNIERDARQLVEKDFAQLFEIAPNEASYRLALARVYIIWKLPAAAELAIRDAIRVAPKDDKLKALLVAFLRTQRDFADAEKSFKELIAAAPTDHIYNYGLANLYLQHELTDKARSIYEGVIQSEKDPRKVVVARNALARLKFAKGDISGAQQQIDEVIKVDPRNEEASLLAGRIEYGAEKFEPVIARMRNLVRDHPKSLDAYRLLAEAYIRTGRLDLAGDTLGAGLGHAPKDAKMRLRLAHVFMLQERFGAALEITNDLTNEAEIAQDVHALRAEIFARSRKFADSLAALDDLQKRGASAATVQGMKARVLLQARDYPAALQAFERAIELGSTTPDNVTGLVTAQLALGQNDAAAARLAEFIRKDPQQAYLHNLLGEVHVRQSRFIDAAGMFRKASELDPRWVLPYLNLSTVLAESGKVDEAISTLKAGVEKLPRSSVLLFALGLTYQRADKIEDAVATYEVILKDNPQADAAANNLAVALVDYGAPDQTKLDRALNLMLRFKDSTNASFLDTLGWVHYRRGEFAEAVRYLERSVKAAPDTAETRYHLGMAYLKSGQKSLAKAELEKAVVDSAKYRGLDEAKTNLAQLTVESAK